MNIDDVLKLTPFQEATVLRGKDYLHNKIESVMVIEALDIEKWAVPHQLLLTSYVAFLSQSPQTIEDFFKKISAIGVSGIILKIQRFIQEVPDFFLDLCDTYHIPLIQIPSSVRYESIILAIHEPLLNYESFLLRSYYDASKTFSFLVDSRYSYETLFHHFIQFTNLPLFLTIPERTVTLQSENFSPLPSSQYLEYEVLNNFAQHHYLIRSYQVEEHTEVHYLHVQNIIEQRRYQFFIQIATNTVDNSLILTIEKFLEVLEQKLDAEYYRKNEIFLHRNKTISSILFGINREDLDLLLEEINLAQHSRYQVLLLTLPKTIQKEELHAIKEPLTNTSFSQVYYESKNTLVYIFNFPENETGFDKQTLKERLPRLKNVRYYLSKTGAAQDIQPLFNTCLKMKQFNDSFYTSNFMDENDLGIFNFLIHIPSENYATMIPDGLRQLFDQKRDLFDTLHCFIINHLNYGATATDLYLHPKTIRYRIHKLQELLQLDLNNPIQLTNYTIGCILLNLLKQKD